MAVTRFGEKRRARKAAARGGRRGTTEWTAPQTLRPVIKKAGRPRFVAVGTVSQGPAVSAAVGTTLSVVIRGRYEVRVGASFDEATLARLVRTLEQL